MARGKGGGDDWGTFFKIVIGVGLGAAALYYIQAGRGEENDAALIPDGLEGRIDLVVKKLNMRFGNAWVNAGLDAPRALSEGHSAMGGSAARKRNLSGGAVGADHAFGWSCQATDSCELDSARHYIRPPS